MNLNPTSLYYSPSDLTIVTLNLCLENLSHKIHELWINTKDNKHINTAVTQWRVAFSHHIISGIDHPLIMNLCIQSTNLKIRHVFHKRYQAKIWCGFPFIPLNHIVINLSNWNCQQVHQINFAILKRFNFWIERRSVKAPLSESSMESIGLFFKYMPWWIHLIILWLVRIPPIMLVVYATFYHFPLYLLFLIGKFHSVI